MERICLTEDIPEREARSYETANGDNIFITQRDGCFYAYQNLCPHLQTELEFLENQFLDRDQEFIECSTHGALFLVRQESVFLVLVRVSRLRKLPLRSILTAAFI